MAITAAAPCWHSRAANEAPSSAAGGVGVAGRQGDHRRHPPRRDRLVHELLRGDRPGGAVLGFQVQDARGAVPGDVQHVGRAAVQLVADRADGGERHHPHVGGVLAGGADRGQHVAQLPLIIQHRPAAGVGGGDRHHDPQRPRQHPRRRGVRLAVQADQRVQGQRAAIAGLGQRLPRQPSQLPAALPGRAAPADAPRSAAASTLSSSLATGRGQERLAQQPPGPGQRPARPWRRTWLGAAGRPTRARARRASFTASASPGRTPPCAADTSIPGPVSRTWSAVTASSRSTGAEPAAPAPSVTSAMPSSRAARSSVRATHTVPASHPSALLYRPDTTPATAPSLSRITGAPLIPGTTASGGHPAQRHRVITGGTSGPLTRRVQEPVVVTGVINHRVPR